MQLSGRKKAAVAALCIGFGTAAFALWGRRGPLPDPLVTQADLPPLPDASDNGWTHLQALPRDLTLKLPDEFISATITALNEDRPVAERWEALVETPQALRVRTSPDHVQALEAWSRAVQEPVFAYDSRGVPQDGGARFLYHKVHQLVLAGSARRAVDGQWDDAKDQLASAIKADRELLASSRSGIGAMVSSLALSNALALAHLFESRQYGTHARLRAELEAVADSGVLDDFTVKQRIVAARYVSDYKVLQAMEDPGVWATTPKGDWRPAILYDAEHTAALLESAYLEYDSDPNKALGCGWLDSLRNPIGCDHFDPESLIARHEAAFTSIEQDLGVARRWSRRIQDLAEQQSR